MIRDFSKLALKTLKKRKMRSWLTMLGIFISIATIFILISLSLGLRGAVQEQFRMLGTDKFFIFAKGQLAGPGTGGAVSLTIDDFNVVEKVSGIKAASYISVANSKIEDGKTSRYVYALGIPLENADVLKMVLESSNIKISSGRIFELKDEEVIMVGSSYGNGKVFGKEISIRDKLIVNGAEFRVKGILSSLGNPQDDKNIYMSYDDFKKTFNSNRIDEIIVQVNNPEQITDIVERVKKKLASFRGVKVDQEDFYILTPEELLESFGSILNVLTIFLAGIAGISLFVGGIGIANTMYTSVLERKKEIGVMKAIGAKNSDILWIFLIESGLLGLVGGLIGVIIGIGVSKLIEFIVVDYYKIDLLVININGWLIFFCLVFSFIVGAISGMIPAIQASRTNIIDALRYE